MGGDGGATELAFAPAITAGDDTRAAPAAPLAAFGLVQQIHADNAHLRFGFLQLARNSAFAAKPSPTPVVPAAAVAKTWPELAKFKGELWPTVDGSRIRFGRACWRWYWKKKGSAYGLLLHVLRGALPPLATVFIAEVMHEMTVHLHDPGSSKGAEHRIVMWVGMMYLCYLLHSVVEWEITKFTRTWSLAKPLLVHMELQFSGMRGEIAAQWDTVERTLVMNSVLAPDVGTFGANAIYGYTAQLVSFACVLAVAFWHSKDHMEFGFMLIGVIIIEIALKAAIVAGRVPNSERMEDDQLVAHTAMMEYYSWACEQAHMGKDGQDLETMQKAAGIFLTRAQHRGSFLGVSKLLKDNVHHAIHAAILCLGGIAVMEHRLLLPDLAAILGAVNIVGATSSAIVSTSLELAGVGVRLRKVITALDADVGASQALAAAIAHNDAAAAAMPPVADAAAAAPPQLVGAGAGGQAPVPSDLPPSKSGRCFI